MKDSIKANLLVFFIIAIISFGASSAFASLTIHEENESYKMIPIENDSFKPNQINEVPTIIPKVENNTTNNTTENSTLDSIVDNIHPTIDETINKTTETIEDTIDSINDTYQYWKNDTSSENKTEDWEYG